MTSTWVARDSMNQPVWNSACPAPKTRSRRPKVRKSKSELTGPSTSMKLPMNRMSQCGGIAMASRSTSSMGIGVGQVVEQIVQQDLDRQHRQEGQNEGGGRHREHVPEVRARPHHHVFHHIAEGAPALAHAALQHRKIGLEQDDVGRILGDIHGRIDGDADIGGMQGGGVIDAVAHEAHHMAAPLQGQDDAVLLGGRDAAEEVDLLDPRAQRLLAERRHLRAGEHAGNRNFSAPQR